MAKRTYSQRGKHKSTYQHQKLPSPDPGSKRHKADRPGMLQLPLTPPPSRGGKKSPLLKSGLRQFDDHISVPDEEMSSGGTTKQIEERSIFDKALIHGPAISQSAQPSIYGSREDFLASMEKKRADSQSMPVPTSTSLPTPPLGTQKDQSPPILATVARSSSAMPADTLPKPQPVVLNGYSPQLSKVKAYVAEKTIAPSKDILGNRLSKNSKEAKTWAKNQETSPILRLPGELRNRIYEYALGGNTINIGFETYRDTWDGTDLWETEPIFKYRCVVFDMPAINPYNERQIHNSGTMISNGFTLLNDVCRQMYLETASLPYQLNLLCFDSYNTMFNFLWMERRLNRKQLDAITRVVIPNTIPQPNMLKHLRNLEKIFLAIQQEDLVSCWYHVVRREGEDPKLKYY